MSLKVYMQNESGLTGTHLKGGPPRPIEIDEFEGVHAD
jgi:hypothetical protein